MESVTDLPAVIPSLHTLDVDEWYTNMCSVADDVVFACNVHDQKHGKGCLRGKGSQYCRARFPQELFSETVVDFETGALRLRHLEPWVNDFSRLISYTVRGNTDVTCLLSGTQVRAVLGYVTDYITKPGLKLYQIFDTIRSVLDKNVELVGRDSETESATRLLLVKIVNSLTAAMEIGGPTCCAYLLGQPDHYTDRKFKVCYWFTYVRRALTEADPNVEPSDSRHSDEWEEAQDARVVITVSGNRYVAKEKADDYVYRPAYFDDWSLYDFLCRTSVRRLNPKQREQLVKSNAFELGYEVLTNSTGTANETDPNELPVVSHMCYLFRNGHPMQKTHAVFLVADNASYVLNWIGGVLPRYDKGDREFYCKVMLIFFKPQGWRRTSDLKDDDSSWSATFDSAPFSVRHRAVMKNMNVLYECQDARDDYSAQRRASKDDGTDMAHSPFEDDALDDCDTLQREENMLVEYTESQLLGSLDGECIKLGDITARHCKNQATMVNVMKRLLGKSDTVHSSRTRQTVPQLSVQRWRDLVKGARDAAVQRKQFGVTTGCCSTSTEVGREKSDDVHFHNIGATEVQGGIKIVSENELNKKIGRVHDFPPMPMQDTAILQLHEVMNEWKLNTEQIRAFTIVATRLHHRDRPQLKMYLGGMAGTGKSRVISAIVAWLERRKEGFRFLILAPTGSAAALVDGSTYHSVLGIMPNWDPTKSDATGLAKIKSRLQGVDLIFLDEVSMLSCMDMYRICAQLAQVSARRDAPFGGLHVIVAGDFAQLPPVGRGQMPLYSPSVGQWSSGLTNPEQESAIGKAIWHQFTTVVILRTNMRQTGICEADSMFRIALGNLRYKACSKEDIALLKTRIVNSSAVAPTLTDPNFRFVSIITAWNAHKDAINAVMCKLYAQEHAEVLHYFHSTDQWSSSLNLHGVRETQRVIDKTVDPIRTSDNISDDVRRILWNVSPSLVDKQIAGILPLCIGMPVLLKENQATELCATNGAEATVYGWDSKTDSCGREYLDTLFVELKAPPRTVQFPELPPNIVPIPKAKRSVKITLPDDREARIQREQVHVLPNFAMTDYASQGRTRVFNVCHLDHCGTHLSLYTCLSRSATLAGTAIIGKVEDRKFRGGLSGTLRQEFRELETLNDITRLEFHGELPREVHGATRSELLGNYQAWKGRLYVPPDVPLVLNWSDHPIESLDPPEQLSPWCIVSRSNENTKPSKTSEPNARPANRKRKTKSTEWSSSKKKNKSEDNGTRSRNGGNALLGCKWDGPNWSCAYDALVTIFWNIYRDGDEHGLLNLSVINDVFAGVYNSFVSSPPVPSSLIAARERLRDVVSTRRPDLFPRYGQNAIAVADLVSFVFQNGTSYGSSKFVCLVCETATESVPSRDVMWQAYARTWSGYGLSQPTHVTCTELFTALLLHQSSTQQCPACDETLRIQTTLRTPPPLVVIELPPLSDGYPVLSVEMQMQIPIASEFFSYRLRGVIYHGACHFTSRYISLNDAVWYHDGIVTGNFCKLESTNVNLLTAHGRVACLLLYMPL